MINLNRLIYGLFYMLILSLVGCNNWHKKDVKNVSDDTLSFRNPSPDPQYVLPKHSVAKSNYDDSRPPLSIDHKV